MGNAISYYGEIPTYDNWYYNSEEQIARIINFLQKDTPNYLTINEENFEITHRAIQQSIKLYSNLTNESVHFVWHTFYKLGDINNFQSTIKNSFLEILMKKYSLNEGKELIKILSKKLEIENLYENIKNDILPIIRKLFGETIILYIDVKENVSYFSREHSLLIDTLIKLNSTVKLKIISNISILDVNSDKVIFKTFDYTYGNANNKIISTFDKLKYYTSMQQEIMTLKSLLILQHPINKTSFDFITKFIPQAEQSIKNLSYSDLIYYLHNGGISFDKTVLNQINEFKINEKDKIALNSMKILSYDYPEDLIEITSNDKSIIEHISPDLHILSLSSAITSNAVNNNKKMMNWYNDALIENLKSDNIININNKNQIEVLINYISQIILLDKELSLLLPLLEKLSYLLAEYIIHCHEDSDSKLIASRWIYKVGYVYDRLKNPNRDVSFFDSRQKIYTKSSNLIKNYMDVPEKDFAINAYRYAVAEYHSGNYNKSLEVFFNSSYILYKNYLHEPKTQITNARHHSYELAIMGLCKSSDSNYDIIKEVINNFIETNGITVNIDTFVQKLRNNIPINHYYPLDIIENKVDIYIFYMNLDTYATYVIAEYLYKEFNLCSKLILYTNKDVFKKELKKSQYLSIIIGAPDTPGGIGESINNLDPTLEHIYQLKMGENFNYPVLIEEDNKYTLILCASGIGGILSGWFKYVEKMVLKRILIKKEKCMIDDMLAKFGLSFIGKVGSTLGEKLITKIINKISIRNDIEKENLKEILKTLNTSSELKYENISAKNRNLLFEYSNINVSLNLLLEVIETYRTQVYIEAKELKELSEDLLKIINLIKSQYTMKKENKDIINNFTLSVSEILEQASNLYNQEIANLDINIKDLARISSNCIDTASKLINYLLLIVEK